MPKATINLQQNNPNKQKSAFDVALDSFQDSGNFTLSNAIVNSELIYFGEYLKTKANPPSEQNYQFHLSNITFNVETPTPYSEENTLEDASEIVLHQLQTIFKFSRKWRVIALHNVTIAQGEHAYPLSAYFIYRLLRQLAVMKHHLNELSITNAEFHPWVWIRFLALPLVLNSLTLALLPNEDKDDNLIVLCEALQYTKIKNLSLGDTEISVEGYHALNKLLDTNYFIEKMQLKEPIDPESQTIFRKINERLVYLDHEKYLEGRLPLSELDLEKIVDNNTRTLGHLLLETALNRDDTNMMGYLIRAGANLFEQQADEKPFLIQVFQKSNAFKIVILNHIIYSQTFEYTAKRTLSEYPDLKEIITKMGYFAAQYANVLRKRAIPSKLSDTERLFNLLKNVARLSRPSKQRDQEFIEIYWRLFKSLILFRDTQGKVTVESVSHIQTILNEISSISHEAEWGCNNGSMLHHGIMKWLASLMKELQRSKKLIEKNNALCEKDEIIKQQASMIKHITKKNSLLEEKLAKFEKEKTDEETSHAQGKLIQEDKFQPMQEKFEAELQEKQTTLTTVKAQETCHPRSETLTNATLNETRLSVLFSPRP